MIERHKEKQSTVFNEYFLVKSVLPLTLVTFLATIVKYEKTRQQIIITN